VKFARSVAAAIAPWVLVCAAAIGVALSIARAQNSASKPSPSASDAPSSQGAAGADMSDMQVESEQNPEAAKAANDAMDMSDMDMASNPHMFMTELQPKQPGDERRAEEIVEILGKSIAKYKDYKVALADNYKIFFPNVKQPIYHFTSIPRRCSTKRPRTATRSSAPCSPPRKTPPSSSSTNASRSPSPAGTNM
jgi:hypothetical protein